MLHELGLARAYTLLGPLPLAIDHYENGLKIASELGDRVIEEADGMNKLIEKGRTISEKISTLRRLMSPQE